MIGQIYHRSLMSGNMSSAAEINLDNYLCLSVTSTTAGAFGYLLIGFNTYGYVYEEAQYIIVDSMDETATNPQWKTFPSDGGTVSVKIGKKMVVKAKLYATTASGVGKFTMIATSSSARCSLRGNCMSLLYGDNAEGETSVDQYSFSSLFNGCTLIRGVSSTFLPATTLGDACYMGTFEGCTSLTSAPELPATSVPYYAYAYMFEGCTSLTSASELPATITHDGAYQGMFKGCTSLTSVSAISTQLGNMYTCSEMFMNCTSLTDASAIDITALTGAYCCASMFEGCTSLVDGPSGVCAGNNYATYQYMFKHCISLTYPPSISVTTAGEYAYQGMFQNCTSLKYPTQMSVDTMSAYSCSYMYSGCSSLQSLPDLSENLSKFCYEHMFEYCTSLSASITLPATTLAEGCYVGMFMDCTGLTDVNLPATTPKDNCYASMFYGCAYLTNISCMLVPDDSYVGVTKSWVDGVSSTGTFVKNAAATWETGESGIPSGWTVKSKTV